MPRRARRRPTEPAAASFRSRHSIPRGDAGYVGGCLLVPHLVHVACPVVAYMGHVHGTRIWATMETSSDAEPVVSDRPDGAPAVGGSSWTTSTSLGAD